MRKGIRRTATAIALGVILAGGALAVADPAFAHATSEPIGWGECQHLRQACLWKDAGAQGTVIDFQDYVWRWKLSWWDGDEVSSVANFTPYCAKLWDNDNWTGRGVVIRPGQTEDSLAAENFNDKTESWQLYRC